MKRLATFTVADRYVGIDVVRVREVIRHEGITPVPLAPEPIEGLINLRGEIVTAMDVRARLELPARAQDESPMSLVVTSDGGPMSLLVDAVGEVLDVDDATFELPPETLRGSARELIVGAYKLDGAILLELDLDRTIDINPSGTDLEVKAR